MSSYTPEMITLANATFPQCGRLNLAAAKAAITALGGEFDGDSFVEARKACRKLCVRIIGKSKKPIVAPAPAEEEDDDAESVASNESQALVPYVAPVAEEDDDNASVASSASSASSDSDESDDDSITIKKSEWEALLARVAALESKPVVVAPVVAPKPVKEKAAPAVRKTTKDVLLTDILNDGEVVYAKELVNMGDRKGEYNTMTAVFHTAHKGFLVNGVNNKDIWTAKREYALSPTTLCSRFRAVMATAGECDKGKSTCCGFAKCYVIRDGAEIRLNKLW
jgi:hypothetical protein